MKSSKSIVRRLIEGDGQPGFDVPPDEAFAGDIPSDESSEELIQVSFTQAEVDALIDALKVDPDNDEDTSPARTAADKLIQAVSDDTGDDGGPKPPEHNEDDFRKER
jgi:hypothetical protein